MQKKEINKIVEALLFASPEPLTQAQLNSIIEPDLVDPDLTKLEKIVEDLRNKYLENDNAFTIKVKKQSGEEIILPPISNPEKLFLSGYYEKGKLLAPLAKIKSISTISK